jgi:hypothetical protein
LTPLHISASKNAIPFTLLLLDAGADLLTGLPLPQYALLRQLKSMTPSPLQSQPSPALDKTPDTTKKPNSMKKKSGFLCLKQVVPHSTETTPPSIADSSSAKDVASPIPSTENSTSISSSPTSITAALHPVPHQYLCGWGEEMALDKKILPVELAAACGHVEMTKALLSRFVECHTHFQILFGTDFFGGLGWSQALSPNAVLHYWFSGTLNLHICLYLLVCHGIRLMGMDLQLCILLQGWGMWIPLMFYFNNLKLMSTLKEKTTGNDLYFFTLFFNTVYIHLYDLGLLYMKLSVCSE